MSVGGVRTLEFGSLREKPRKYYLMLLRQILLLLIFILLIHMLKGDWSCSVWKMDIEREQNYNASYWFFLFILFSCTLVKKVEIQLQTVELSIAKLIMQKFLYQSYLHWEGDFMVKSISSKVGVLPRSSESLKVPLPLQHMQREGRWADHWCSPMSDRYFT